MSESIDPHLDLDDAEWVAPEIDELLEPYLGDPRDAEREEDFMPAERKDSEARGAAIAAMAGSLSAADKLSDWQTGYDYFGPDHAAVTYASPDEATFVTISTHRVGSLPVDWHIDFQIDTDMLGRGSRTEDILAAVDAQAELRTGIVQALQAYTTSQVLTDAAAASQRGLEERQTSLASFTLADLVEANRQVAATTEAIRNGDLADHFSQAVYLNARWAGHSADLSTSLQNMNELSTQESDTYPDPGKFVIDSAPEHLTARAYETAYERTWQLLAEASTKEHLATSTTTRDARFRASFPTPANKAPAIADPSPRPATGTQPGVSATAPELDR